MNYIAHCKFSILSFVYTEESELMPLMTFGSSHPEAFCKKVFLEISQNSQGNTCARTLFLIKLLLKLLKNINKFIKKRLWQKCFPDNFAKLLRGLIDDTIMRNIFCNIFQNDNKLLCYLNMLEFDTR